MFGVMVHIFAESSSICNFAWMCGAGFPAGNVGYRADVSSGRSKTPRLDSRRCRLEARSTLAYHDVVYRTSSWIGPTMRNPKTYHLTIKPGPGHLILVTL